MHALCTFSAHNRRNSYTKLSFIWYLCFKSSQNPTISIGLDWSCNSVRDWIVIEHLKLARGLIKVKRSKVKVTKSRNSWAVTASSFKNLIQELKAMWYRASRSLDHMTGNRNMSEMLLLASNCTTAGQCSLLLIVTKCHIRLVVKVNQFKVWNLNSNRHNSKRYMSEVHRT